MRVQITVPRNTLQSVPLVTSIMYPGQEINIIDVGIPPGHAFLTGIQILAGNLSEPIVPAPGSNINYLVDDANHVVIHQKFSFDTPSFRLTFKCYNLSNFYPHTFTIDLE